MFSNSHIITSIFWKYLERSGSQVAQFVLTIVLARMLAPEDFGLLTLVMVFITLANVLTQRGLRVALVQKKDANSLDFSSAFWFSLMLSAIVYVILFFASPLIANFYENGNLTLIVRILGLNLFFGALSSVQEAYIQKHFLFKKLFFRSLAVIIPSGLFGVFLAYFDFGIWALIWQQVSNAFLMCIFMLFMVSWKPAFEFSSDNIKKLFGFGYKLLLSDLFIIICDNLVNIIIGKSFSPTVLGFYNRGEQFPRLIITNVNDSINTVLFPVLVNVQDDIELFKQKLRNCIKYSCFALFPLMALLASSAKPTIELVLGEKWLPCLIFLQINCFIFAFWPIYTANLTALNSLGRSDIILKLEFIKKIVEVSTLIIALYVFNSVIAIIIGFAIILPIRVFIHFSANKYLLCYGFYEQIKDVVPAFILSLICGIAVFPISFLNIPNIFIIALQVSLGLGFYLFLAKMFKMEAFNYLRQILKNGVFR